MHSLANVGIFGCAVGLVGGFSYFLRELNSPSMDGSLFRINVDGERVFTPSNIAALMTAPFKKSFLWQPEFWSINWLVTSGIGACIGTCISTGITLGVNNAISSGLL